MEVEPWRRWVIFGQLYKTTYKWYHSSWRFISHSMVFVPIKVNVLLWRVVYNKLPTRQNLVDRNVDIPSFLCQSCSLEVEDCKHVFVDCEVASQVWIKVVKWLDLPFPLIINVTELLYWVNTVSLPALKKKVLEVIVLSRIWMIW